MVLHELLDVLFWRDIKELVQFYKELDEKYWSHELKAPTDPDEYRKQTNAYIVDYVKTKENFIKIIDEYNISGKPIWQEQAAQNCDNLSRRDIPNALQRGSYENGERLSLRHENAGNTWALHLEDYGKAVNYRDDTDILELSIGGGLGTYGVIKNLSPNNRMISIDIDFACVKNADGIAKYFNVADRVCGLNANFWFLPFENGVLDTICTHYGLDESGELPTVLKEVSRVLKNGGRFAAIARKNPYDRHKRYMDLFDIAELECTPLLKKARLYSGFDDLCEVARTNNLSLVKHKFYEPEASHHRILYIFEKHN